MVSTFVRIAICMLVLAGVAPGGELRRYEYSQAHMGTEFKVVFYADDPAVAAKASVAVFERIARLDATMSDYSQTSELNGVSARAGSGPVKVSQDLFRVLARAEEVADASGGAFDVTCGPAVLLWRRARRTGELPDSRRIGEARELVGGEKLRLDRSARTVALTKPGMRLDLGGIAKGFAADEALLVLRGFGIRRALVAASGDIAVGESPPGASGWRIDIAPLDPSTARPSTILLSNGGVSTSGDSEQYVEIGGVRYSHIVDPRTAVALVEHSSVTVVAPDATTSDSLATALSVLGPTEGVRLADATDGVAAMIVRARDGVATSSRWSRVRKQDN